MRIARQLRWITLALIVSAIYVAVAAPQLTQYQSRLTDDAGIPLNGDFDLTFTIYDSEVDGTAIWTETHSAAPVSDGIVELFLGGQTPLASSVFDDSNRWLEVTVGMTVLGPRKRLGSSPYAHATNQVEDKTLPELLDRTNHTGTQSPTTISPQGVGSGIDADMLDGATTGSASGEIPVNDGTLNTDLNADLLDGLQANEIIDAAGQMVCQESFVKADHNDGVSAPAFTCPGSTVVGSIRFLCQEFGSGIVINIIGQMEGVTFPSPNRVAWVSAGTCPTSADEMGAVGITCCQ